MSDLFLTPIWDPQTHKAPKMTFPKIGPERTFFVLADTLRIPKIQKHQSNYFFRVDLLISIHGFH